MITSTSSLVTIFIRIFNQPATRPTYMPDPQQPISKKCVWWTLYRIHVTESKKCMLQNCPLDNVQLIFRKKGVIELLWISCLRYTLESSSNMHCSKLHNLSHLHHPHTSYTINIELDTSLPPSCSCSTWLEFLELTGGKSFRKIITLIKQFSFCDNHLYY